MNTDPEQEEPQETQEEAPIDEPAPRRFPITSLSELSLLAIGVAVVIVAALVLSIVEWSSQNSKANRLQNLENLRASATKFATVYGVDFGSYDYTTLRGPAAPWAQIEAHSTAKFRSEYTQTSNALAPTIVSYKAKASATVPVTAIATLSNSRAIMLIVLSQTITNSAQKSGPQTTQFLVTMSLVRQKGQWLIDNLQASA
jgi:Mce-associated membrane protein